MESKARARYIRVAPRKVRFVIDAVRGLHVQDALDILTFTPNAAAKAIEKVVKSAMANAENNLHINGEAMRISEAYVDEGPTLKRIQPRAKGRAYRILKRTSHISVVLEETEKQPKRAAKREPAKPARPARRRASQKSETKTEATAPKAETKPKAEPTEQIEKTTEGGE